MKYILHPDIALRSWTDAPYAYIKEGELYYHRITKEAYELLESCDGIREVAPSLTLLGLIDRSLVRKTDPGEALSCWQRPRIYNNPYFPNMNWAITGKCNMNCRHCFMAKDNAPLMDEFSFDQCRELLDECERSGIFSVTLTGGEPMLHPDFMNILRECKNRHILIKDINTNGTFITGELLQEIKSLGHSPRLKISFDGIGHHDWLRNQEGAEEKVLDAIKLSVDAGFDVMVQTNVHRGNVHSMYDTVMMAQECGVPSIRIMRTSESPRWMENGKNECLDIGEYYESMLELSKRLLSSHLSIEVDIWQFIYISPKNHSYSMYALRYSPDTYKDSTFTCKGARTAVAVASTGELSLCNQFSGTMERLGISYGNVKKDKLSKLLCSGPYHDSVNITLGDIYKHSKECQRCQFWKYCGGGCRAIAFAWERDLLGPDKSKCYFYNYGYPKRVYEELKSCDESYRCINSLEGLF